MSRRLTIRGTPRPASRPRVTGRGTFYSKPYKEWKAAAVEQVEPGETLTGSVSLFIEVMEDGVEVGVFTEPDKLRPKGVRGDIDNYAKAVLDVLQDTGVIENDRQVERLTVSFDPGRVVS